MSVNVITTENFDEIISSNKTVLVDFWAGWCGPCRMLAPTIDEIADNNADVYVGKVNVDEQSSLAEKFGIMSIPTLLVFKDGKLAEKSTGVKSMSAILDMLK